MAKRSFVLSVSARPGCALQCNFDITWLLRAESVLRMVRINGLLEEHYF